MSDEDTAIRTLFRMKSERLTVADALLFPLCEGADLAGEYSFAIGALRHCAKIRNQYAHSNWADTPEPGLYFVDLIETARSRTKFEHKWLHTDTALLELQEQFFYNTLAWFNFLRAEFESKHSRVLANLLVAPPRLSQPLLHNPPELHIPPWTSLGFEDPPSK